MKKDKIIKEVVETGGDITGNIGGAVLGGLIAGPAGVVIGGISGPILTKIFKKLGSEIQQRILSPREEIRIGGVYTFAINKINENELQGKKIRDDSFFYERDGNRSCSEELLEGVILTAQKEYEERKIKFLGNLYGNICTDDSISGEQANQLIKMTNILTYRQLCMVALYYEKSQLETPPNNIMIKRGASFDIIAELTDLYQKGILWTPKVSNESANFSEKRYRITEGGQLYYKLLDLNQIDNSELENLNIQLQLY